MPKPTALFFAFAMVVACDAYERESQLAIEPQQSYDEVVGDAPSIVVQVSGGGEVKLDDVSVQKDELLTQIEALFDPVDGQTINLNVSPEARTGLIIELQSALYAAGYGVLISRYDEPE